MMRFEIEVTDHNTSLNVQAEPGEDVLYRFTQAQAALREELADYVNCPYHGKTGTEIAFEVGAAVHAKNGTSPGLVAAVKAAMQNELRNIARKLYVYESDNDPVVHSNRFPSWEELSEEQQQTYVKRAGDLSRALSST